MYIKIYDIIKGPIVTNKAYKINSSFNKLVLEVHMHANKPLVKEALEKLEKDGEISKDDLARAEKELEKVTGDHVAKIDELLKHKEAELLEV